MLFELWEDDDSEPRLFAIRPKWEVLEIFHNMKRGEQRYIADHMWIVRAC